jgi:hypothetical protein
MLETLDLEIPSSLRAQRSNKVALLHDPCVIQFLVMVAGHSYVVSGWEVGYPLLARNYFYEAWPSARIGIAFLIGSIGLLFHTLFTYPAMVKKMGLCMVWSWSWVVSIIVLIMFPRMVTFLLTLGFDSKSCVIIVANYMAQLFISVLQGCNFTTLQLMLHQLINVHDHSDYALPLAKGWMVSLQGLARAVSPVMTGSFAASPSVCHGVLAFDALACVAAVCCLLSGQILKTRLETRVVAVESEASHPSEVVADEDVYEELEDTESASSVTLTMKLSNLLGRMLKQLSLCSSI